MWRKTSNIVQVDDSGETAANICIITKNAKDKDTSILGDIADSHQKIYTGTAGVITQIFFFWFFFVVFFTKKCVKFLTTYHKIFNKRNIYRNWYLFIFDTKMTIFPREVRHILARRDVCLRVTANYLHVNIFDQNLNKVWIFCVLLLYVLSSCEAFQPVWWPLAAARWERKQEIQSSLPDVALEGDWTADQRIKSGLLLVPKFRKCAGKCKLSKNQFFLLV